MKALLPFTLALLTASACSSGDGASGTPADLSDTSGVGTDSSAPDAQPSDTSGTDSATSDSSALPGDSATADSGGDSKVADGDATTSTARLKNVFIIVLENHNWSSIKGSSSAPYINGTLLKDGAHAEQYYNPAGLHPSEPNYIWLEAGDNLGMTGDGDPSSSNHSASTDHLVSQLDGKGISWKSYQEDITGSSCPLSSVKQYAPKHDPMVFFDDVTDALKTTSANCIAHVRPYTELATDLAAGKAPRYSFITPNLCNDMHGAGGCPSNTIATGDTWLSNEVPKITASSAYKDGGVIFIVWDEASTGDGPIGMIVLSPFAKVGYAGSTKYTHSSTLKTIETIFGVPFLRDAGKASTNDLSDLFTAFP